MFKAISIVSLAVALSACASSDQSLQTATASSIGGRVTPDRVVVDSVERGMMNVTWTATVNGQRYTCSADDMVRRPYCAPVPRPVAGR